MERKSVLTVFVFLSIAFTLIGFSSAAEYHGEFVVNTGSGDVIFGCEEDWSSSFWSSCSNGVETFVCIQSNSACSGQNLKPSNCDQTRACTEDESPGGGGGGSGGGGGGGSNNNNGIVTLGVDETGNGFSEACIESWSCQPWSNSESSCGIRSCRDLNSCGTTILKPETSRDCPSTGLAGITGAVVGGISNFAKANPIPFAFIIIIVALTVIINVQNRVNTNTKLKKELSGVNKEPNGNSKPNKNNNTPKN